MFPNLGYLYQYFFGSEGPSILYVIQSFGFMMALAFLAAAYVLASELKRKEKQGLIKTVPTKIIVGKPASVEELVWNGVIGFFIGLKLIGIITSFSTFQSDPQSYLLSLQGSYVGGIVLAIALVFMK